MNTNLIDSLRRKLPSIYAEDIPEQISYCRPDGHEVVVSLENATLDEIAFAIQSAAVECSGIARRRAGLEAVYAAARRKAAPGAVRIADLDWEV